MVVVAGVTGHVGSVVARELLSRGEKVKVFVRDAEKGRPWSQKGAEVAVGSLEDEGSLTAALRGASGFFVLLPTNFAAPDVFAWQKATSDRIAGAVRASRVPHVVLLSSVGADLAEGTGPIKGLHYLENALRATGATLTAIRAGYFQENVESSLAPARQAGIYPNLSPSADAKMPMIATRDIGELAAKELLAKPAQGGEAIDLHGPAYSVREVAEKLGAALGKPLQVVDIPQEGWVPAMVQGGIPPHVAEVFAEMYRAFAQGIIRPKGDRAVQGQTGIDEVIRGLVRSPA